MNTRVNREARNPYGRRPTGKYPEGQADSGPGQRQETQ